VKTHFPDFTASDTGLPATWLAAGFFATGFGAACFDTDFVAVATADLTGLLPGALVPRTLRALGGAALARPDTDDFDFAGAFLVFDAALAMAYNIRERRKR
jgi:hypothetical protein